MKKIHFLLTFSTILILQVHCNPWNGKERNVKLSDVKDASYVSEILRFAKAAEITSSMNESVNPCEDFYEFACGNWKKTNPTSFRKLVTGFFENLKDGLNHKIGTMLRTGLLPNDTSTDRKIKQFYASCMHVSKEPTAYKAQLLNIIAEFGEMPALSGANWNEQNFDWLETIAKIAHKYGKNIIIKADYEADYKNNSMNRVHITRPELVMKTKSFYLDPANSYYRSSLAVNIAHKLEFVFNINLTVAQQIAKEIRDFEIELAKGMEEDKTGLGPDELLVLTTLEAMQEKYGSVIDIKRLVNISLGELITLPVYENNVLYQENLKQVIPRTENRILANYIYYNLVDDFIWLPTESSATVLQEKCIEKTKKYFIKNLDNMVYRQFQTKDTENGVNNMWQVISETFKQQLLTDEYKWLNATTRNYAVEKLQAMKLLINSYESHNLTAQFADLLIDSENYVQNVANLKALERKQKIAEAHHAPKTYDEGETLSFTPINIETENIIKIPVAVLQPYYFWAAEYPNALKFGNLGSLVGHELMHGFDDVGRKYDKYGNGFDWWDDNSTQAFVERTKCFIEQYSKYRYGGRLLPKSTLQAENIADNGGLNLAYAAYLRWYEDTLRSGRNLNLEILPTMHYTNKQLFFISFAQMWCNEILQEYQALVAAIDTHTPGKFRVIGTLSNFAEFSETFKCAAGSKMNPPEKCRVY